MLRAEVVLSGTGSAMTGSDWDLCWFPWRFGGETAAAWWCGGCVNLVWLAFFVFCSLSCHSFDWALSLYIA